MTMALDEPTSVGDVRCANCGATLAGAFCHDCGQRAADHLGSVRTFVAYAAEVVLQYDSRGLRTARDLLTRPGALTADHLAGRRARHVPPLQTFGIAVTVLFLTGAVRPFVGFDARTRWFRSSLAGSVGYTNRLTDAEAASLARRGISLDVFGERFTSTATAHLSTFLIASVPLFALALAVARRRRPLTHHVVFALHWSAFYLAVMTLFQLLPRVFPLRGIVVDVTMVGLFAYLVVALRRVYRVSWLGAGMRALPLLTAYLFILVAWLELVVAEVRAGI